MICEKSMLDIIFKTKTSRFFLPFILLTFTLLINNNHKNYVLLSLFTFFDSIIILSNFNSLVTMSNAKPLYFEDLYIDTGRLPIIQLNEKRKELYKKIYTQILILSNSILMTALVCYWRSKITNVRGIIEIIGITGGLIEIATCLNSFIGKLCLFIIKKYIRKQIHIERQLSNNNDLYDNYEDYMASTNCNEENV